MPPGCDSAKKAESNNVAQSSQASDQNFKLTLYSDKENYIQNEQINIWAELVYTGDNNTITIWHDIPYVSFTITDGKKFNTGGMFQDILTSTVLEKGKVYTFPYGKTGGFDADAPDAAFWQKFYSQKELYLLKGTYTVSATGAFSLTKNINYNYLKSQITIDVK